MCYPSIGNKGSHKKGRPAKRVTPFELEDQDLRDRIDVFMFRFKIGTLLNRTGIGSFVVSDHHFWFWEPSLSRRLWVETSSPGSVGILLSLWEKTLTKALARMLSVVWNKVCKFYSTSEKLALQIIQATMKTALALIRLGYIAKCESWVWEWKDINIWICVSACQYSLQCVKLG